MTDLKKQSFKGSKLAESERKSNLEHFQPRSSATYSLRQQQYISVPDQIRDVVKREIGKIDGKK